MSALDDRTSLDEPPEDALAAAPPAELAAELPSIEVAAPPAPSRGAGSYVLLAAALLAATVVGWLAGGALDRPPAPPPRPHVVHAGGLRVAVDGTWRPATPPPPLAGLGLRDLRTFSIVDGAPATAWTARARIDGPTLLPAALRAAVGEPLPRPRRASLAGRPAWAYRGLSLAGGSALDVVVAPTRKGSVIVGCSAPFAWWGSAAGCASGVVALSGSRSLRPGARLAARRALPRVIRALDRARRAGASRLRHARRPRALARAARGLAAAHRRAAGQLLRLLPARPRGPVPTPGRSAAAQRGLVAGLRLQSEHPLLRPRVRPRGIVHALRRSAAAYAAVAAAARDQRDARYRRARTHARRADAALRDSLRRAS